MKPDEVPPEITQLLAHWSAGEASARPISCRWMYPPKLQNIIELFETLPGEERRETPVN